MTNIRELVELMQKPIEAASIVEREVAQLGPEPTDYMHIALLAAAVHLEIPAATQSHDALRDWVLEVLPNWPTRHEARMRVLTTALIVLQTHRPQSRTAETVVRGLEAVGC